MAQIGRLGGRSAYHGNRPHRPAASRITWAADRQPRRLGHRRPTAPPGPPQAARQPTPPEPPPIGRTAWVADRPAAPPGPPPADRTASAARRAAPPRPPAGPHRLGRRPAAGAARRPEPFGRARIGADRPEHPGRSLPDPLKFLLRRPLPRALTASARTLYTPARCTLTTAERPPRTAASASFSTAGNSSGSATVTP
jgi:periplasmic protein TonB